MAQIIDGKAFANGNYEAIKMVIAKRYGHPGLAIMRIGDDPAGDVYVRNKMNKAAELGISCVYARYSSDEDVSVPVATMKSWADDPSIHGIILQLPAPGAEEIMRYIPPEKDVDGFGLNSKFVPCTPAGIQQMLLSLSSSLAGKHAVVVGRSEIVGKPLANLLLEQDCTVTVCHSKTQDLAAHTRQADILVVAAGKPNLITAGMVKPGVTVIDVGINRVDGKLVGDVDFEGVKEVASWITPVPGGVGPMTVAMLMENVTQAWIKQTNQQ